MHGFNTLDFGVDDAAGEDDAAGGFVADPVEERLIGTGTKQ